MAGIGSNPISLESYLANLNTNSETTAAEFNFGDIHATITQNSVDVYMLELNLLGLPRDERTDLAQNYLKDFLVDFFDADGNKQDLVLQDGITVMIVNKGSTPLKIGVTGQSAPAETTDEGGETVAPVEEATENE